MSAGVNIPMFPLTLLPLPGELVPLHIFEPRYRQLLQEAEVNDISFGIYFSHEMNAATVGSLMKLESVIKRYSSGESDVIIKCTDIFTMNKLHQTFKDKLYPGGEVHIWNLNTSQLPQERLSDLFVQYMTHRNITQHHSTFTVFQIANELNMDFSDRYKFLMAPADQRETILVNRIKFLLHILNQEMKSKDVFHLN